MVFSSILRTSAAILLHAGPNILSPKLSLVIVPILRRDTGFIVIPVDSFCGVGLMGKLLEKVLVAGHHPSTELSGVLTCWLGIDASCWIVLVSSSAV